MPVRPTIGFYGKLPSHGDFLRRRVSDAFVAAWDEWVQRCLEESREALAGRWLEVYLTSPAWRFSCAAGVLGPEPVLGMMVPSVDGVGRYFPLALVAQLDPLADVVMAALEATRFFDSAEGLVLATLDADRVDFDDFDKRVMALSDDLSEDPGLSSTILEPDSSGALMRGIGDAWHVPVPSARHLGAVLGQLMGGHLAVAYRPLSLWWTEGSTVVEPSCLVLRGLPSPSAYTSLLDGVWRPHDWQAVGARSIDRQTTEILDTEPQPPRFHSAAATDVGRKRSVNQDAYLERSEVGLWAVADGLGGHTGGEVASRMVCDALADFEVHVGFEDMVEAAGRRVQDVNTQLNRAAEGASGRDRSGSTVVALFARGTRCTVLWAGDSRVYRWREGRLSLLTEDHSLAAVNGSDSTAVTRAVGGEETLALDRVSDRVHIGDRFLLCSDGLTRSVPDAQICTLLETPDIRAAVEGLIQATLSAGAPDNVTAVVVEAIP